MPSTFKAVTIGGTIRDVVDAITDVVTWFRGSVKDLSGQYGSPLYNGGPVVGATLAVDWNNGNEQLYIANTSLTLSFTHPQDGFRYILTFKRTDASPHVYAFPANVLWVNGVTPTAASDAGCYDLFTFQYLATDNIYLGAYNRNYHS